MSKTAESAVKDYYTLLKPGVMLLIIFTGIAGFSLAEGPKNFYLMFTTMLAIGLASGGAAALNMWYDRDIDKIMERTKKRPIPLGKIADDDALIYGILLCIFAIMLSYIKDNYLSTLILIGAIFFYVVIYTIWLKRRTPQNIVIGGAAGAFPPLISYSSISGTVTAEAFILFLIIFLWTPPHFWALALYRNNDYRAANIPMLPVVKGEKHTLLNILIYTFILIACSTALYFYSSKMGLIYLIIASAANLYFLYFVLKLYLKPNDKTSIKAFIHSIFYLFIIFAAVILDSLV